MFKKILLPVDPAEPEFASDALEKASQLARDYGAKIHLLAVCPEVQSFVASQLPEGFQDRELKETAKVLEAIGGKLDVPGGTVDCYVRMGSVYHEVIEEADKASCDLILMTSHRPGLSTYFIGSNAAHIVRHAPCSVMVLRGS
ncbi:universal stress protein [Roseibium denhamense]|uniref:Nucleotide-binding universal stress protein, UspA family n=1 Tax=Roseibium denhamense TaxID=76305 RepID=A0ABY1N898_9HYPH|nr:universal stress protein [Roseibium denhamense]MTI05616.1 universal stress protein [Roseibium denhamense]SMP03205.1 Nucleotide-binding universal stress protein, UspA family [Roseibium denhamense]